ncbi:hypothetical protein D9M70_573080 [compost metagenome]
MDFAGQLVEGTTCRVAVEDGQRIVEPERWATLGKCVERKCRLPLVAGRSLAFEDAGLGGLRLAWFRFTGLGFFARFRLFAWLRTAVLDLDLEVDLLLLLVKRDLKERRF